MAYFCDICNLSLEPVEQETTLIEHLKKPHNFKCSRCKRHYTRDRFEEHKLKYHPFTCEFCDASFTNDGNLLQHKDKKHAFRCTFCIHSPPCFNNYKALQDHIKDNHPEKASYFCIKCRKLFSKEAN